MNINAISSFNNVAKAQAFKGESKKECCCCCGQNHNTEKEVTYASWGPNYVYPVEVDVDVNKELASANAQTAYEAAAVEEPISFEEMEAQRLRYLRD